jgi:hypothetical protein
VLKDFHFSVEGEINSAGISVIISPNDFSLEPGQSVQLSITFTVDEPAKLPVKHYRDGYFGNLVVMSDGFEIRSPISLINTRSIKFNFEGELPVLVTLSKIGSEFSSKYFFPETSEFTYALFEDWNEFDVIAQYKGRRDFQYNRNTEYYNYLVFAEDIVSDTALFFSKSQAENDVTFRVVDEIGNLLNTETDSTAHVGLLGFISYFLLPFNTINFENYFSSLPILMTDSIHVSDMKKYQFQFYARGAYEHGGEKVYQIAFNTGPVMEDTLFSNNLDLLHEFKINVPYEGEGLTMTIGYDSISDFGIPYRYGNYYSAPVNKSARYFLSPGYYTRIAFVPKNKNGFGDAWETGVLKVKGDSLEIRSGEPNSWANFVKVRMHDKENCSLGESLIRWSGLSQGIFGVISDRWASGLFTYANGEKLKGIIRYDSYTANHALKKNGAITNPLFPYAENWGWPSKWYTTDLNQQYPYVQYLDLTFNDYAVQGKPASTVVKISFAPSNSTSGEDNVPPFIDHLSLEVNGKSANRVMPGQPANINLNVYDDRFGVWWIKGHSRSGVAQVSLMVRSNTEAWTSLSVNKIKEEPFPLAGYGGIEFYSSNLPDNLPEGYYDLKVIVADSAGNAVEQVSSPTFLVGSAVGSNAFPIPIQVEPFNHQKNVSQSPGLKWKRITSAKSYTLQLFWRDSVDSYFSNSIVLLSRVIAEVTTTDTLFLAGPLPKNSLSYYWRVRANYESGHSRWSEGFTFQTGGPGIVLVSPSNKSLINSSPVHFEWEPFPYAKFYWIQVVKDTPEFFSPMVVEDQFRENYYDVAGLEPGKTYYWRVVAALSTDFREPSDRNLYSEVFEFTVPLNFVEVLLVSPLDQSTDLSPPVQFIWSPVNGSSLYKIQFSLFSDFSEINYEATTIENSILIGDLLPGTTYFWRVSATVFGYQSWSLSFTFTTMPLEGSPILLNPQHNAVNIPVSVNYLWTSVADATLYLLQVSRTIDFLSIDKQLNAESNSASITGHSYLTTYYWKVAAIVSNDTLWSDVFQFRTTVPSIKLVSPPNNAANLLIPVDFSWSYIDGVDLYQLQVSKSNSFSVIDISQIVIENSTTVSDLLPGTTYYWRIGAEINGTVLWSNYYKFSTEQITAAETPASIDIKPVSYPNPFSSEVYISFYSHRPAPAAISIYNMAGQKVKAITVYAEEGINSVIWDGTTDKGDPVSNGVFMALIAHDSISQLVKMVLRRYE